jgi:hypothetical protein
MIDQPTGNPYPAAQPSYRPLAIRYGGILGAISIAFGLIGYLTDTDPAMPDTSFAVKLVYQVLGLAASIWAISTAIKIHRDRDLGGYISLGRATMIGLAIGLVAGIIAGLFTLLYTSVINPEYLATISEMTQAELEEQGMSEEQIEMAGKMTGAMMNPLSMFIMSVIGNVVAGTIIGLIAGLVLRREPRP